MSLIKRNVIANFTGNGWSAILSIIVIPLYIHFLGIESYGLIGISVMLISLFSILDVGLTVTIGREMARLSTLPDRAQDARDLVRSIELPIWFIALAIGLSLIVLSHSIAHDWVKPEHLSLDTVQIAVILMGISIVVQWPSSFYASGLAGLQRQVLLNAITAGMTTIRCLGAVMILWLVSSTLQAFFIWQIIASLIQTALLAFFLWRSLPQTYAISRFQPKLLSEIWRFTAGAGGSMITGMMIAQMDKIILSKILSLDLFGYYSLASSAATSLSRLISPLVIAVYPRMTQLVALGNTDELKRLYHGSCQLMSVIIFPIGLMMAFFAQEILLVWTQNPLTAQKTHMIMVLLTMATMFNGLSHLPISLQYAHGKAEIIFKISFATVILMAPIIYVTAKIYGVYGAAAGLVGIFFFYTQAFVYFTNRQLLREDATRWYVEDIGRPVLVSLIVAGLARFILDCVNNPWIVLFGICIATLLAMALSILAGPEIRQQAIRHYIGISR